MFWSYIHATFLRTAHHLLACILLFADLIHVNTKSNTKKFTNSAVCPRPQRPSFFVLPGAKQKHTHSLLQKGFFRRALRRALSSMPFVNMYPARFYAGSDSQIHSLYVLCIICRPLQREKERAFVHTRTHKALERK